MATAEQLKKMGIKQEDYIQSPGVIEDSNKTVKAAPTTVVKQPVLNETNPQYAALIQKGYTPEQISNAWKGIQEKQKKVKPITTQPETEDNKITNDKVAKGELPKDKAEIYDNPNPNQQFRAKKEGEPSYTDISDKRKAEINTNLEAEFAANPNKFNNFDTFKSEYNFDKRVPQQQIWLKNRYDSKKEAIATNSANQVKLTSLTNLNDASLANISSADAVFLMNNDPTAYLRYQDALKKKNNLAMINSQEEEPEEDPYSLANIMKSFGIDMGTAEAISTETAEPRKELDDAKMEYDKAKREYDNILADTQKQYQGETSSFINAMAAKKQRELLPDLQTKLDAYNTKVASYNNVLEERKIAAAEKSQKLADFSNAFAIYKANYEMNNKSGDYTTTADPLGRGYIVTNKNTGETELKTYDDIQSGVGDVSNTSLGNLTGLAAQYPNEASFKNNNPTGIKITAASAELKRLWDEAGIKYSTGTNATDGGAFARFNTIEDGMEAYDIAMTKRRGNSTVKNYLDKRGTGSGGTGLSSDILGKKINQLTEEEKNQVQSAQIKKESPGLWKELFGGQGQQKTSTPSGFNTLLTPKYEAYLNTNTHPIPDQKELYNMYGISDPKKATQRFLSEALAYKNNTPEYGVDKDAIYQTLSPEAKALVDGKSKMVGIAQTNKLNKELSDKGRYNLGLGNQQFFRLTKQEDTSGLVDLLNMSDKINTMINLDPTVSTNSLKAIKNSLASTFSYLGIPQPSSNYLDLKAASGKALTEYIKKISGTAVSDQERQRLEKYMPNVGLSDKEFKSTLKSLVNEYNNIINGKLEYYGFDDIGTFKTALLGQNKPLFSYGNIGVSDIYNFGNSFLNLTGASGMINKDY